MATTPTQAIVEIRANPKTFLDNHLIRIFGGGPTSRSDLTIFRVFRSATDATTAAGATVPRFDIHFYLQAALGTALAHVCAPGVDYRGNYEEMEAYYIAMKSLADVQAGTAVTHFVLPTAGNDLMLTSQLSACTFGIGSQANGSGCMCSHIEGDPSSWSKRKVLKNTSLAQMPQGGRVYQKNSNWFENAHRYKGKAMIVGKRDGHGIWKFFSQRHDGGMGVFIVSKVHEI